MEKIRLGLNIDHVATLRNVRGEKYPQPLRAALLAQKCGVDGITIHLREDRRHIKDEDAAKLKQNIKLPINLEIAATKEMVAIACKTKPHAVCIVPERREELTTEGGLDVIKNFTMLAPFIKQMSDCNIKVSLFVDAQIEQIAAAKKLGAKVVEIHTGCYCNSSDNTQKNELEKIINAANYCQEVQIECHAGHGLNYENVAPIAAIPQIVELNIGHFLIAEALFIGLEESIAKMRRTMDNARSKGYRF